MDLCKSSTSTKSRLAAAVTRHHIAINYYTLNDSHYWNNTTFYQLHVNNSLKYEISK